MYGGLPPARRKLTWQPVNYLPAVSVHGELGAARADARREGLAGLDSLDAAAFEAALPPLRPSRRRAPRRLGVIAAVAAAMVLLCIGAYALWPEMVLEFSGGKGYLHAENIPDNIEGGQFEFGYLPEGWEVEWVDDMPEGEHYKAEVYFDKTGESDSARTMAGAAKRFIIMAKALDSDTMLTFEGAEDEQLSDDGRESVIQVFTPLDTIDELTWQYITNQNMFTWVTANKMYIFCLDGLLYTSDEGEEIVRVLQNITD